MINEGRSCNFGAIFRHFILAFEFLPQCRCIFYVDNVDFFGSRRCRIPGRIRIINVPELCHRFGYRGFREWIMDVCWGIPSSIGAAQSILEIRVPLH
jgi:hypothetical protein